MKKKIFLVAIFLIVNVVLTGLVFMIMGTESSTPEAPSQNSIKGLYGVNKHIRWSGENGTKVWSNQTTGTGGTLEFNMSINSTTNITEIKVFCDNLDASITASKIGVTFSSDNVTWDLAGVINYRTFADGGGNVTINYALWTNANGCYGANPFDGAGLTNKNTSIFAHFILDIPVTASPGFYEQNDWKIYVMAVVS